jgi:hypothetical protein
LLKKITYTKQKNDEQNLLICNQLLLIFQKKQNLTLTNFWFFKNLSFSKKRK